MRGRFFAALTLAALAALQTSAQYYRVTLTAVGDKASNLNFPKTEFLLEEGSSQLKGFEARINAAGFGAEGFKPVKLIEKEIRENYEKALEEELARKPEEKLAEALEMLENRAANMASFLDPQDGASSGKSKNGRASAPDYNKMSEAERKALSGVMRQKMAAEKAMAEYQDFKKQFEKAKRNRALMKELVDEMDKKTAERLKSKMLRDSVHQSGYPYGTYYNIALKKVSEKQVLIDFEAAVSFMTGWQPVDGNNNNNSINSSIKMEYVDMPTLEDIAVDLGKRYCFQIARPVDKGGTLQDALDGTTIFAQSLDPAKIKPMHQAAVKNFNSNPLNRNGLFTEIQKEFRGREREVVRIMLTITKQ